MLLHFITVALAVLVATVRAEDFCQEFGYTPLQCFLCGYDASAPIHCIAYNATFDDLSKDSSIGIYKNTKWTNFQVKRGIQQPSQIRRAVTAASKTVYPYSPLNFARLPQGKTGVMIFGYDNGTDSTPTGGAGQFPFGSLRYFHYACVVPGSSPPKPVACSFDIKGTCVQSNASTFFGPQLGVISTRFHYTPLKNGSMVFEGRDYRAEYVTNATTQRCANYTFSVRSPAKAELLLDDVLYNTYADGYHG